MKNERQRTRELASLSAYLDGELSPADRQALVARLQNEPDLGVQLEKLRRIKLTLGYLPRLHAPRNYTLTPEMVTVRSQKKSPFIAPLRLASALAAILLVVLFGVEFLFTSGPLASPQMASAPMLEAAMVYDDAEPQPLIVWGHPGTGGGADMPVEGRGGDGSLMMEAPVMVESMPVEVEGAVEEELPAEELTPAEAPESMLEDEPEMMLEAEILPPTEVDMETLEMAPEGEKLLLILGINPEQGGEVIFRSGDTMGIQTAQPAWRMVLRVLQIALGAIVVGGGLTWWLLLRQNG
jgi:hypothetical protein